jgi:hypothetical protein
MNRILKVVAAVSLAVPLAGMAQPVAQTANQPTQLTKQQLRDLTKTAHESAQFKQLADYYRQQEADYRAKAAEEKIEWDRRAQMDPYGTAVKIPSPANSAERLYESYVYEADHNGELASHYDQLAATPQDKL